MIIALQYVKIAGVDRSRVIDRLWINLEIMYPWPGR